MILTAAASFLLSVYNGPSAAVVDELGPPQFAATLQAVSMFGIHVLGNAPAPSVIGRISDQLHWPISRSLQAAIVAFGLSGVAVRHRRAPATNVARLSLIHVDHPPPPPRPTTTASPPATRPSGTTATTG